MTIKVTACSSSCARSLFGVRLIDGSIRKSASMGKLTHYAGSGSGLFPDNPDSRSDATNDHAAIDGYASEYCMPGSSSSRERKGYPQQAYRSARRSGLSP
ncbi:hypothetical protein FF1_037431 [Malus domestica]